MRAKVDQLKCETIGICVKECPQVFRFQYGSKKATVIVDEIQTDLERKCREVAKMCPNNAIIIEE
jgi:ferredoxin